MSKRMKKFYENNSSHIKGKTFEEVYGIEKKEIRNNISEAAKKRTGDKNAFLVKNIQKKQKKKLPKQIKEEYHQPLENNDRWYFL